MDDNQAKKFGAYLQRQRNHLGIGRDRLSALAGLQKSTLQRIETGFIRNPDPDKLTLLAEALGLDPADVLERAGYAVPTDLLTPATYLRAKYPDLTDEALRSLTADVARALKRHGINATNGPKDGEDEQPEPPRTRTKK
jgi:transcriptional regulator with XRE-family HTH domain